MRHATMLIPLLLAVPGHALGAQRIPPNPFPRAELAPATPLRTQAAFYAAMAGESLGVPVAVHLANGRRGRSGGAILTSLAIGAGGLGAAILCDEPALLLAIPVGQIASAVAIERSTARDRE